MNTQEIKTLTESQTQPTIQHLDCKRPIAAILSDLSKPIPERFLESRTQGRATLTYIPWYNVCKLLDYYAPGWQGEIMHIAPVGDRLVLTYRISIFAEEGIFTREATGTEMLKELVKDKDTGELVSREIAYGDPSSNAESMALRRAAAKFGLGLYLYDK
jgi:hypothetical protein